MTQRDPDTPPVYTDEEIERAFSDVLTQAFIRRGLERLRRLQEQRTAPPAPSPPTDLERHRIRLLARKAGLHVRS